MGSLSSKVEQAGAPKGVFPMFQHSSGAQRVQMARDTYGRRTFLFFHMYFFYA
jgi:hypothetical protein